MGFTKESLWALRREVMLNSLFIADYRNSRHIDPRVVCDFFDGFLEIPRLNRPGRIEVPAGMIPFSRSSNTFW